MTIELKWYHEITPWKVLEAFDTVTPMERAVEWIHLTILLFGARLKRVPFLFNTASMLSFFLYSESLDQLLSPVTYELFRSAKRHSSHCNRYHLHPIDSSQELHPSKKYWHDPHADVQSELTRPYPMTSKSSLPLPIIMIEMFSLLDLRYRHYNCCPYRNTCSPGPDTLARVSIRWWASWVFLIRAEQVHQVYNSRHMARTLCYTRHTLCKHSKRDCAPSKWCHQKFSTSFVSFWAIKYWITEVGNALRKSNHFHISLPVTVSKPLNHNPITFGGKNLCQNSHRDTVKALSGTATAQYIQNFSEIE